MSIDKNKGEPVIKLGIKLIISGKKGESLFYNADMFNSLLVMNDNVITISKQLTRYITLVNKAKEERLLALIAAMSIEEALDSLLSAYIPDYKRIPKKKDFTSSMKIEIAKSLRLIPRHIMNTANLVRAIRNEFAHDLSIDSFDSLNEKNFKNKLKARFKEFFPEEDISNMALNELFAQIVQSVVSALELYKYYSKAAKEYIYSEDFINELDKRIKSKVRNSKN